MALFYSVTPPCPLTPEPALRRFRFTRFPSPLHWLPRLSTVTSGYVRAHVAGCVGLRLGHVFERVRQGGRRIRDRGVPKVRQSSSERFHSDFAKCFRV